MRGALCLLFVAACQAVLYDEWIGFDVSAPVTAEQLDAIEKYENGRLANVPFNFTTVLDIKPSNSTPPPVSSRRQKRLERLIHKVELTAQSLKDSGTEYVARVATMKKMLEDAVDLVPTSQDTLIRLGEHNCLYARQEQDLISALKAYGVGIAHNVSNATAITQAAHCMWKIGLNLHAIKFFEAAAERGDTAEAYHFLCTATKHRLGTAAALTCFERAIARFPNEGPMLAHLGIGETYQGQYSRGIATLKRAEALTPDSAGMLAHLGYSHWYVKEYATATAYLRRAVEQVPKSPDFVSMLGQALRFEGKEEEAQQMFRKAVTMGKWLRHDQRPMQFFPPMAAKPWHLPKKMNDTQILEENVDVFRSEAEAALQILQTRIAPVITAGEVKSVMLVRQGTPLLEHCELLPKTCDILFNKTDSPRSTGSTFLSLYAPNTHIAGHCGQSNVPLRIELGLTGLTGNKLRVANETRELQVGKVVVYDASYDNEFWSGSDTSLVLTVDVFHHELVTNEMKQKAVEFVTQSTE